MAVQIQGADLEEVFEARYADADVNLGNFALAMPAGPAAELLPHLIPVLDRMLSQPPEVVRQQVYSCLLQDPRAPFDADVVGQAEILMAVFETMQGLTEAQWHTGHRMLPLRA